MKVVAYVRVSTDQQADHGVSLDVQRAKVRSYADLYDLELVEVIADEGWSAKSLRRPGLERALAMLERGDVDGLLVAKLDRLTRSVRDLGNLVDEYFRDGGRALLSVGEQVDTRSANGRMVLTLLTTIAEWERETIGERTAAALAHLRDQGYRVGAVPYGHEVDPDGKLVEHAGERRAIELARTWRAAGLSYRAIGRALLAEGCTPRAGGAWHPTQVQRMCA